MAKTIDSQSLLRCSFCGKSQYEVTKLIAGPTVFICNECIDLCGDILKEEQKKTEFVSRWRQDRSTQSS